MLADPPHGLAHQPPQRVHRERVTNVCGVTRGKPGSNARQRSVARANTSLQSTIGPPAALNGHVSAAPFLTSLARA